MMRGRIRALVCGRQNAVALVLNGLPRGFHKDPADRLIVATARAHALPLATWDATLRRSRLMRVWKAD